MSYHGCMVERTGIAFEDMQQEISRSFSHIAEHFNAMSDELAHLWNISAECANMEAELDRGKLGCEVWDKMVDLEGKEGESGTLDHLLAQLNDIADILKKNT